MEEPPWSNLLLTQHIYIPMPSPMGETAGRGGWLNPAHSPSPACAQNPQQLSRNIQQQRDHTDAFCDWNEMPGRVNHGNITTLHQHKPITLRATCAPCCRAVSQFNPLPLSHAHKVTVTVGSSQAYCLWQLLGEDIHNTQGMIRTGW